MSNSPPPVDEDIDVDNPIIDNAHLDAAATTSAVNLDVEHDDDDIHEEPSKSKSGQDDLFFSTISDLPSSKPATKTGDDMDDIFREHQPASSATKDIKLTDDEDDDSDPFSTENSKKSTNTTPNSSLPASINIKPVIQPSTSVSSIAEKKSDLESSKKQTSFKVNSDFYNGATAEEDEEDRDKFIEISLGDATKVGDGMGSYMVYKITTKTNFPAFKQKDFSASRRFSDFLNLYEKLKEKHLPIGRILPPAPEKDMIGMAKVKMSKEETSPIDFIDKRRAALERFVNRLGAHKTFRFDPDFREFLETSDDLPKATNTSALSGASMLKMFKNVTDSVSKITGKMEETDQWFEERSHQVENLHVQYKKMHSLAETLYGWRKDLASATKDFSKSANILANSEEQLNLSRALSQLGEVYEKIEHLYNEQSHADYFIFAELLKDYVGLFENIKEVLHQRVKTCLFWQKAEETLKAKRDSEAKIKASNKQDKLPAAAAEVKDWEGKVEKSQQDFELISKTIKEEMKRFDLNRIKELKTDLNKYLETLLKNQEVIVKIWESYLPQVKAI